MLVPIIGNVVEYLMAISVAIKSKSELSMEIAVFLSLQIALFVAPALMFTSLRMGNSLNLGFNEIRTCGINGNFDHQLLCCN